MMTNELRKVIKTKLNPITPLIYYQLADKDAMYPHIIFSLDSIDMLENDRNRFDYSLIIDIYNELNVAEIEDITDEIVKSLNNLNLPKDYVLPTFYLESRRAIKDEDKKINHRQLEFVVQTYERN